MPVVDVSDRVLPSPTSLALQQFTWHIATEWKQHPAKQKQEMYNEANTGLLVGLLSDAWPSHARASGERFGGWRWPCDWAIVRRGHVFDRV